MKIIELKDVFFEYDREDGPVLKGFSLDVDAGDALILQGDNGSGKTTVLRVVNGLSFPRQGSYLFKGEAVTGDYLKDNGRAKRFHKAIGYLFQNPDTMLFNSTVYDEIAFGPRQMGLTDEEVDRRVQDLLGLFELRDIRDRVPYHLSGGQKKWVALASVMALDPEVVTLDEPFAGLDERWAAWLMDFLSELKAAGRTLIIATHREGIAEELGGRKIEMGSL
ncbi:MAG: ABC transporter ATP-binding protein [Firmicutes bacterium]|nr:ABC transporter ATP-binding protein [Bacillota bacterium]MBQ1430593.1 ABC transporter ATP-binding protein [Bacillota bacterium]MBQ1715608.1 ABC transporter ATP-binding protein [Bacillota bacterium]